jgi:uncharacterized membrane protein
MKLQRMVFIALVLAAALQVIHFYPLMPDKMASHFNAAGQANAWMQRDAAMPVHIWVGLAAYVVFMIGWSLRFIRSFSVRKDEH